MGEILIDEPDLIIDDPAGDCVDYWTALVKEDKTNNNILQTEDTVQVSLFEKNTGHKKPLKEKKSDLRKKIKNILRNSTFPPEQISQAVEGYVQDPSLMDMRIDQVDPSSIFLFDVCSENFLTAFDFERKGMLQPIEDAEFDWKTFQDCQELNLLSKHQDDFEPGEVEDEEPAPKRESCRTERYESPERHRGERTSNKTKEAPKSKYQDRRQDEHTKENEREKDRDRERRNSPERKRPAKFKDQIERRPSERDNQKERFRQQRERKRSSSEEDRDQKSRFDKFDKKEQSRDKERDRSHSKERNQERRRTDNYMLRRDEDRYQKPLRPYDNQAQRRDDRENRNYKAVVEVDEKETRDNGYRTNKVMVIDDEPRDSSKYGRQFYPDRRRNYQQENPFPKTNEMGQLFMQFMTNMMGQFMNGGNTMNYSGFPNRYHTQRPPFNNNNYKRYQNNYNNNRGGFQRKPFYSNGNNDNDRRNSNGSREKENHRNQYNNDETVTEVTRRRNY